MTTANAYTRTIIAEDGSVMLPDHLLECAGLKPGDEVIIATEDGHLVIQTDKQLSDQIKQMFSHVPPSVSLADELIKERRAEYQREQRDYSSQ